MVSPCPELRGQHSTALPAGQHSDPPRRTAGERYGPVLCGDGYTALPNTILAHYARLGVSEGELVFIQQVWSYWWDEALPFPSVSTLAARMGKTQRQIQHYIGHLRALGLLRVVGRRDAGGGQLSNAYDLRPFLRAVEDLIERGGGPGTPPPARPEAAEGVQVPAPPPLQVPASEADPTEEDLRSISISMPPYPRDEVRARDTGDDGERARCPDVPGAADPPVGRRVPAIPADRPDDRPAGVPADGELQLVLARLGLALGDSAPRSSATRASRLRDRHRLEEGAFVDALEEVGRRVVEAMPGITRRDGAGGPNAMPYLFASLEAELARARRSPVGDGRGTRRDRRQPGEPGIADPGAGADVGGPPDSGPPVWDAVRAELRETLAPGVFALRVLPLRAVLGPDGALVLEAETAFMQRWVELRLRPHIERILRAGGTDIRVHIVAAGAGAGGG